jgi:SNF2 family DNA or RNA helicase
VRIGQKRGVRVYKFVCKDTIEEALQKILERKDKDFANIIERLSINKIDDSTINYLLDNIDLGL